MKKYFYIFKSEVMSNLQYIFNILTSFVGYFIMLFIFFNLWQYIYSDPNEFINGYSMNQMVWYVIITEILWGVLGGKSLCRKISNDVKTGNIAYNINKPYNYVGYALASHLGSILVKAILFVIVGMFIGFIFLGSFPSLYILSILAVLLTGVFATVISTLLVTAIGLISFFLEDSNPLYWLYSKFILIIGTIFPIEYFPSVIQPILKFSPIYVVCYGPAKLFVDFTLREFLSVFIFQLFYIFLAYLLCLFIYNKGVKNLNVNGG